MNDVDREMAKLEPKLRRIEQRVREAGLSADHQATLMTMCASRLMATAGAMMAAAADYKAGRPASKCEPNDIANWMDMTAKEVVRIFRAGHIN